MDWRETYRDILVSADEAVKLVKPGDRVMTGHAAAESRLLMEALMRRKDELRDVELWQAVNIGPAPYCAPEYEGVFTVNSTFLGKSTREAVQNGKAKFTPLPFHNYPKAVRDGVVRLDCMFTMISPPDAFGFCSYGVSVDYTRQCHKSAKYAVAEINPNMPRTYGDTLVHIREFDRVVEGSYPLYELVWPRDGDPVAEAIGKNVASMIRDGDTIQIGAGSIPNAILKCLKNKRDLGMHTEVFSDNLIELVEEGVITGRKKTLHPGKIVSTFIQGTKRIYDYANQNPYLLMMPVDYVNNPAVISQNDNMVAINAAVEVDLTGQIVAEAIGTKQYSGIGGQADFLRGAAASKNGRPIITLPATAAKGKISRISVELKPGTPVTTSRNDVFYVVTEYGVASLFGKSIDERAKELIRIAHPDFRAQLREGFLENYHIAVPE